MDRQRWQLKSISVACLLLTWWILRLIPSPRLWVGRPTTPFDNGPVRSVGPAFELLKVAGGVIPLGASAVARQLPGTPTADTYFHRAAVALLPGRQVLPAALWFQQATGLSAKADYVIILGNVESYPGFDLLARTTSGSVWRRQS